MNRYFYQTDFITNHDLIIKQTNNKNIFQLQKLKKINLNIGSKKLELKEIKSIILLLEILSNQKGFITKSKKNKITLKIKKGSIVGCKITLRKKNMFQFFEKLIFFYFPKNKNFKGIKNFYDNQINLSFKLSNIFELFELTNEFFKFKNISNIDITICSSNINKKNSNKVLLNSYNFPIFNPFN